MERYVEIKAFCEAFRSHGLGFIGGSIKGFFSFFIFRSLFDVRAEKNVTLMSFTICCPFRLKLSQSSLSCNFHLMNLLVM